MKYRFIGYKIPALSQEIDFPSLEATIRAYVEEGCPLPVYRNVNPIPQIWASPVWDEETQERHRDVCLSLVPMDLNSTFRGVEDRREMNRMMNRCAEAGISSIVNHKDLWQIVADNINASDIVWQAWGRNKSLYGPVLPDRLHPILRVISPP